MSDGRTIVIEMDLPAGLDWQMYEDLNIVAVRRGMSERDRERALDEVQREWRRSVIYLVPDQPPPLTSVA